MKTKVVRELYRCAVLGVGIWRKVEQLEASRHLKSEFLFEEVGGAIQSQTVTLLRKREGSPFLKE